ncbi:hypothetical protein QCA50_003669 [Cerrena zonata]|uniref:Uncharacterized protein n=1 Tax=Cerrena zonata TaxID=2478898 RepID=A0AAW0GKH3_9APHY
MVRALKITGDVKIPRGAIAWTLNVDLEGSLDQDERQLFGEVQPGWKIFVGTAAVGDRFDLTERPLKGVITSLDEIRLRIGSTSYISRCCRYR